MVPQLDSVIGFNFGDNCGLDPIIGFSCDIIQLWYHKFVYIHNNLLNLYMNIGKKNIISIKME